MYSVCLFLFEKRSPKKSMFVRWQIFRLNFFIRPALLPPCFLSTPRSSRLFLPYLYFRGFSGFPLHYEPLSLRTFPTSVECLLSRALSTHGQALGARMKMLTLENAGDENGGSGCFAMKENCKGGRGDFSGFTYLFKVLCSHLCQYLLMYMYMIIVILAMCNVVQF